MSLINNRDVQNGLIDFIQRFTLTDIGIDLGLSTMIGPTGTGTQPSVIRDIAKGARPDFPFIVVDQKISGREKDAWLRNISVENDKPVYTIEIQPSFSISCYGNSEDHDILSIMSNLRTYLTDSSLRAVLNTDTQATFQFSSDVTEEPTFLETDFINSALMSMTFTTINTWSLPSGSIIERVVASGSYEGDFTDIVSDVDVYFFPVLSVTDSAGTARFNFLTFTTSPADLSVGDETTISGFITNTDYNGTFTITDIGTDFIEVANVAFGSDESGGVISSS